MNNALLRGGLTMKTVIKKDPILMCLNENLSDNKNVCYQINFEIGTSILFYQ
jgi:hypothetical protein